MSAEEKAMMEVDRVGRQHAQLKEFEGSYDAASKTYTYAGDLPDRLAPDKNLHIRQTILVDSAKQHTVSWFETRGDGKEAKTMQIVHSPK